MLNHADLAGRAQSSLPTPPPLVTVAVCVYNHARYLAECLDSVLATEYPNLEIIVVDDASLDDSDTAIRDWLSAHPEARVVYVRHDQNLGLARTLNEVAREAKGDYFVPIAADDVMLPNGIQDRVLYLVQNPDKIGVFADCHVIDERGQQLYESGIEDFLESWGMRKKYLRIEAIIPYSVVFNWAVPGPVIMWVKNFLDVIGPYDEDLLVEDWDTFLRAAQIKKLGFCDAYVSKYRVHDASMTSLNTRTQYLLPSFIQTIEKHLGRTHGLVWLQLLGNRIWMAYYLEERPLRRFGLWLGSKVLLAITKRLHLALRWFIYTRHRVTGGGPAGV